MVVRQYSTLDELLFLKNLCEDNPPPYRPFRIGLCNSLFTSSPESNHEWVLGSFLIK